MPQTQLSADNLVAIYLNFTFVYATLVSIWLLFLVDIFSFVLAVSRVLGAVSSSLLSLFPRTRTDNIYYVNTSLRLPYFQCNPHDNEGALPCLFLVAL